jgi:hypothetical protein
VSEQTGGGESIERTEIALEVLANLSERAVGDGRLRDAIAVVRDALWSDLDDDPVYPPGATR